MKSTTFEDVDGARSSDRGEFRVSRSDVLDG